MLVLQPMVDYSDLEFVLSWFYFELGLVLSDQVAERQGRLDRLAFYLALKLHVRRMQDVKLDPGPAGGECKPELLK